MAAVLRMLQEVVSELCLWANDWDMDLNAGKTRLMVFGDHKFSGMEIFMNGTK